MPRAWMGGFRHGIAPISTMGFQEKRICNIIPSSTSFTLDHPLRAHNFSAIRKRTFDISSTSLARWWTFFFFLYGIVERVLFAIFTKHKRGERLFCALFFLLARFLLSLHGLGFLGGYRKKLFRMAESLI